MTSFINKILTPILITLKRRAVLILAAVAVGAVLSILFISWQVKINEVRRSDLEKTALNPIAPSLGGSFTLVNQDGKIVTERDFLGKYRLVYFGYTFCPDMCPTGLQSLARTLDLLKEDSSRVRTLFITIDPARDTPAKLKEYVSSFNPTIVALTGNAQQIAEIAKAYQVYYSKQETAENEGEYVMDHSSLIYLMDPAGKLIATYPEEVDPKVLVSALRKAWGNVPTSPKSPP